MNQIAPAHRPTNGRAASPQIPANVEAQARQLDGYFKSLARQVLSDDDPAGELPLRQLRVCIALVDRPHAMSELARMLGVSQSAITQIADRLESAGLATRVLAGGDRRVRSLQLTPRARKMLRAREETHLARVAQILARMSSDDRRALLASMQALSAACQDGDA